MLLNALNAAIIILAILSLSPCNTALVAIPGYVTRAEPVGRTPGQQIALLIGKVGRICPPYAKKTLKLVKGFSRFQG